MRLLSIDQTADLLRTTPVIVYDLERQGALKGVRTGLDLSITEDSALRHGGGRRDKLELDTAAPHAAMP